MNYKILFSIFGIVLLLCSLIFFFFFFNIKKFVDLPKITYKEVSLITVKVKEDKVETCRTSLIDLNGDNTCDEVVDGKCHPNSYLFNSLDEPRHILVKGFEAQYNFKADTLDKMPGHLNNLFRELSARRSYVKF